MGKMRLVEIISTRVTGMCIQSEEQATLGCAIVLGQANNSRRTAWAGHGINIYVLFRRSNKRRDTRFFSRSHKETLLNKKDKRTRAICLFTPCVLRNVSISGWVVKSLGCAFVNHLHALFPAPVTISPSMCEEDRRSSSRAGYTRLTA